MTSAARSNSPWFLRFSIKTLLVLMLASAAYVGGWVSNEKRHEWIAERERAKAKSPIPVNAPGGLQAVRIVPIRAETARDVFRKSFDVPDGKLYDKMSDPNLVFPDSPRVE